MWIDLVRAIVSAMEQCESLQRVNVGRQTWLKITNQSIVMMSLLLTYVPQKINNLLAARFIVSLISRGIDEWAWIQSFAFSFWKFQLQPVTLFAHRIISTVSRVHFNLSSSFTLIRQTPSVACKKILIAWKNSPETEELRHIQEIFSFCSSEKNSNSIALRNLTNENNFGLSSSVPL